MRNKSNLIQNMHKLLKLNNILNAWEYYSLNNHKHKVHSFNNGSFKSNINDYISSLNIACIDVIESSLMTQLLHSTSFFIHYITD